MWEKIFFKNKIILIFSFLMLFACMGLQFYFVFKTAVNIPWWDEWEYLKDGALISKSFSFLFSFFGEERLFFPKLYTLILLHFDDWNIRHQILINWFIYSSALFVLFKILWKVTKGFSFLPIFFAFLYANFTAHNALFGFSMQYYFPLLFAFLAIYFGYLKTDSIKNTVLFSIFSVCSIFSMTFLSGIGLLIPYLIKERQNKINCIIASLIIVFALILFFVLPSDTSFTSQYEVTLPFNLKYWLCFSTFVFSSICNQIFSYSYLLLILFLTGLICLIIPLFNKDKEKFDEYYVLCALIFYAFCVLSGIIAGRTTYYGIEQRHFIIINWLVAVIPCLFAIKKQYIFSSLILILICLFSFKNVNYFNYYVINANREISREILALHLYQDEITIKELFNASITQNMLMNAQKMNCSWYNDLVLLNKQKTKFYEKK